MATDLLNEKDPVADFLAREENDLQELDDDFNPKTNHVGGTAVNGDVDSRENEIIEENGEDGELNGPSHKLNSSSSPQASLSNLSTASTVKVDNIKEEPEKLRKWREDQQRLLEEKDKEEIKRKEELREQAKRELEEWYTRYAEQLEKSKHNNRNAEKEWIAERDSEATGLEWEKIAKMCDFNPKAARNTKDTSRMRSILLQLKQTPPSSNVLS